MSEKPKRQDAEKPDDSDQDEDLAEGLEETFPASDPPASTQPGGGGRGDEK